MKALFEKLSILLLSIFTISAGAVAATVPLIIADYPNVSPTAVQLLMTIPSLGIILFTPVSNFVADKIGIKNTVLTGLFLIALSGIVPIVSESFVLLFISRIIIGLGTGLIASFSQSIIMKLYSGDLQGKMIGLANVVQGLGMFLMTFLAGVLLSHGWRSSYAVYLIALLIFVLVYLFIPKSVNEPSGETNQSVAVNSKKIDSGVWGIALFAFLFNATFAFISIHFASLVIEKGYGTASEASTLLGIMAFAMAMGGFLFMFLQKKVANYTMAVGLLSATLAFLLLAFSTSLVVSAVGIILVGISVSLFMASMITLIGRITSSAQVPFSTSIAITFANIGTLLAPYYSHFAGALFHNQSSSFFFLFGTIIFAGLFLVAIMIGKKVSKTH